MYRMLFRSCRRAAATHVRRMVAEREWLRRIRRTIDVSVDGVQREVWQFEIDWRVVGAIAADCGVSFEGMDAVPFPLLMLRRYVATDCRSADERVVLSQWRVGNALGALMMTYQMVQGSVWRGGSDVADASSAEGIYRRWCRVLSNDDEPAAGYGGNLERGERNRRIREQQREWYGMLVRLLGWGGVPEEWYRSDAAQNSRFGDVFAQFLRDAEQWRRESGVCDDWAQGSSAVLDHAGSVDENQAVRNVFEVYELVENSRELVERYPVLAYLPVRAAGLASYDFRLVRYEHGGDTAMPELVRNIWRDIRLHRKRCGGVHSTSCGDGRPVPKGSRDVVKVYRPFRRIVQTALLFRENAFEYGRDWLRESVFRVYRGPSDCRPAGLEDCGFRYDRSVACGSEIVSVLRKTRLRANECTRWITIPRFRMVIPFLLSFVVQTLLCALGAIMVFAPGGLGVEDVNAAGALFSVLTGLQVSFTMFIARVGENAETTRVMLIPRCAAVAMTCVGVGISGIVVGRMIAGPSNREIGANTLFGTAICPIWSSATWFAWCTVALTLLWPAAFLIQVIARSCTSKTVRRSAGVLWGVVAVCGIAYLGFPYGPAALLFVIAAPVWLVAVIWIVVYLDLRFRWSSVMRC